MTIHFYLPSSFKKHNVPNPIRPDVEIINNEGIIYLTGTKIDAKSVISFQAGQFDMKRHDMSAAYKAIINAIKLSLKKSHP